MSRRQTRRAVSLSRALLDKLRAYAKDEGVAVSALVEFWLESRLAEQLNSADFDSWYAARAERLVALQAAAGRARQAPRSPAAPAGGAR